MTKQEPKNLFLNVTIHDASMAVKEKITKRLGILPKPMQSQAAQAANFFASRKKIVQALGQKLCIEIPQSFMKKGVTVEMQEIFREGAFIVFQLQVVHVSTKTLDQNWIRWFSNFQVFKEKMEEELLPSFVTKQLTSTLASTVDEKMALNNITAETKVNGELDQLVYFELKLEQLKGNDEEKRNMNPLKKLKKRRSEGLSNASTKETIIEEEEEIEESSTEAKKNGISRWNRRRRSNDTDGSLIEENNKNYLYEESVTESKKIGLSRWSLRRRFDETDRGSLDGTSNKENRNEESNIESKKSTNPRWSLRRNNILESEE